jgi:hypothetical protein
MRKFILLLLIAPVFLFSQEKLFHYNPNDYTLEDSREQSYTKSLADSNLTIVGEWPWGPCRAVAARDGYTLIGNGKLIQVMNISDPSSPKVAAEYNTGGLVRGLALRDSLAFVCSGGSLKILNISNLFSPVQIGYVQLVGAKEVVPTDSFAYVLEDPGRLPLVKVIDITDPSNPRIRSSTAVAADWIVHMAVKNRYIYVSGYNWPFLTIIDARNPDQLVHNDAEIGSHSICIQDTFLFLGISSCLGVYSIANPINPVFLDTAFSGIIAGLNSMTVCGNYVYATSDSGLFSYNISDPYNAFFISRLKTEEARFMLVQDSLLHMARDGDYCIVNIHNPDSLYTIGKFYTGGTPNDIAIQGNFAYVATGRPGLTILDLSNPTSPVRVGVLDFGKETYRILIKDTTAYVGSDSAVNIINISSAVDPVWINQTITPSYGPSDMYIDEQRLYCLIASTGTAIYDITIPSQLQYVGFNNFAGRQIIVRDKIAYHAGGTGGFVIVDVHDPNNSKVLSTFPCYAKSICLKDSFAFIANAIGLYSFDISNPSIPESLSYISTPTSDYYTKLNFAGTYIYISSSNLVTVDISNPYNPTVVGQYSNILGNDISSDKKYIYMCYPMIGIKVFRNDLITSVSNGVKNLPNKFILYQNFPNPFNSSTKIKFQLPFTAHVQLSIYNILGEEITTLIQGRISQGEHEVVWNSEDLPSGLYLYSMISEKYSSTKKLLLIK